MAEFVSENPVILDIPVTKRMEALLQMMEPCQTIADIGCDHGKLCVLILKRNLANYAIASDISEHSLEKARDLFVHQTRVPDFRVGDGLDVLGEDEAQGIVIAGMGGRLMADILQRGEARVKHASWILCQPMQQAADLRRYLREKDYLIQEERIAFEEERYFEAMKIIPSKPSSYPKEIPAELSDEIGPRLWEQNSPILRQRLVWVCDVLKKKINDIEKSNTSRARKGKIELEKQLNRWQGVLDDLQLRAE